MNVMPLCLCTGRFFYHLLHLMMHTYTSVAVQAAGLCDTGRQPTILEGGKRNGKSGTEETGC